MPFRFQELEIPGMILVEPRVFTDERGFFMEIYKRSDFAAHGIEEEFRQDNHSRSPRGALRGLHYQRPPSGQSKLVRAVRGEVFDVVVDMRKGSPAYGHWVARILSAENNHILYVPAGCAHGFCVLSEEAEVVYKTSAEYAAEHEGGVIWNDPDLGIEWPLESPLLSARDRAWPRLAETPDVFRYRD